MRDQTESTARADHPAAANPQAQSGDAETLANYILTHYGMSAPQIAEGVVASRRGNDTALWVAIQNHVGAGQMQRAREAYVALAAAPEATAPATAAAPARAPAPAAARAPARGAAPTAAVAGPQLPDGGARVPTEREVEYLGVRIVARPNTHVGVLDRAREIVAQLLQHNPAAQRRFADDHVTLIIFPSNVEMTSVPEFATMEKRNHTETPDGRDWSTVRGSGGTAADGGFNVGVGEEQLVRVDARELLGGQRPYPAGYSVGMHELAHALLTKGLSKDQRNEVKHMYEASRRRQRDDHQVAFTEAYGGSNVDEYFAQCTNAYFGRNALVGSGNGKAWLAEHDPDMLAFLTRLYEGEQPQSQSA